MLFFRCLMLLPLGVGVLYWVLVLWRGFGALSGLPIDVLVSSLYLVY